METHGRHATVAFTGRLGGRRAPARLHAQCALLQRRRQVFDPLSGYADLVARRVRFIGDAARAHSRGLPAHPALLPLHRGVRRRPSGCRPALCACVREREGLACLSANACARSCCGCWRRGAGRSSSRAMLDYGLLALLLAVAPRPALLDRRRRRRGRPWRRRPMPSSVLPRWPWRSTEDADRLRDRLRLSNDEHARLARLGVRRAGIGPDDPEHTARARLYEAGAPAFSDCVLTSWARSGAPPGDPGWLDLYRLPDRWQPPRFPLSGDDVMALGIPAGPRVGATPPSCRGLVDRRRFRRGCIGPARKAQRAGGADLGERPTNGPQMNSEVVAGLSRLLTGV